MYSDSQYCTFLVKTMFFTYPSFFATELEVATVKDFACEVLEEDCQEKYGINQLCSYTCHHTHCQGSFCFAAQIHLGNNIRINIFILLHMKTSVENRRRVNPPAVANIENPCKKIEIYALFTRNIPKRAFGARYLSPCNKIDRHLLSDRWRDCSDLGALWG